MENTLQCFNKTIPQLKVNNCHFINREVFNVRLKDTVKFKTPQITVLFCGEILREVKGLGEDATITNDP